MKKKESSIPKVGDIIYVDSDIYLSHGLDDKHGGRAKVIAVEIISNSITVTVEPFPQTTYYWDSLQPKQKQLKKEFGKTQAYKDPDVSPEFNENYAGYNLPELDPAQIEKNKKIN